MTDGAARRVTRSSAGSSVRGRRFPRFRPSPAVRHAPRLPAVLPGAWPLGPRDRYAHTGVLVGAAAGGLLSLAVERHPAPGAFFSGLLGYMIGMFFD